MMHGFMNICASMQQYTLVSMKLYVDYTCSGYEYMCFHVNVANLTALTFSYVLHADRPSNRALKEESKFKL